MKRKWLSFLSASVLLLCLLLSLAVPAMAATESPIRVGYFPLPGFYDCAADGTLTGGYGKEYMTRMAADAGISFEWVKASSWVEALSFLDAGKIDLLAPSQKTADRTGKYEFGAFPLGTEYGSLLTRADNDSLVYEDFATFNGKKVGCVPTIVFMNSYLHFETDHRFYTPFVTYKDTAALVAALDAGEVDAILCNLMVKTDTMKVLGKFGAAPYYYMSKNHGLADRVDKAMQSFNSHYPTFQTTLTQTYFSDFVEEPFSRAELDFVAEKKTVTVGLTDDFAPQSYAAADGKPAGADVDILKEIAAMSGLSFTYQLLPAAGEADDATLKDKRIQMVAGVENRLATSDGGSRILTNPYMTVSKVFLGFSGQPFDLKASLRVAVAADSSAAQKVLENEYPRYTIVRFDNQAACFAAVKKGEADVVLENRNAAILALQNPRYDAFAVLPWEAVSAPYSFSVLSDGKSGLTTAEAALVTSIINKSIARISHEKMDEIAAAAAGQARYNYSFTDFVYEYRFILLAVLLAVIAVIVFLSLSLHTQKKSRMRVEESERKLKNITDNINGGVVVLRTDGGWEITFANEGFWHLIGTAPGKKAAAGSFLSCVCEEDAERLDALTAESHKTGEQISFPLRLKCANGELVKTLFNGTFALRDDGTPEWFGVVLDITEQAETLEALHIAVKRTDLILEKANSIIFEVDLKDYTISTSQMMYDKFGWTFPEKLEAPIAEDFLAQWRLAEDSEEILREHVLTLLKEKQDTVCNVQLVTAFGETVWCQISQYPICGEDGEILSVIGNIQDIEREMTERHALERQAQCDELTGLLNKEAFSKVVMDFLPQAKNRACALLFIDLDHFKNINDTLGHMVGDQAIQEAAQKLTAVFSHYDILSRFGGDEFCVFVKDVPTDTLKLRLDGVVETLKETYSDGEHEVSITCSIGAACTETFGTDFSVLIDKADKALYKSKENGRSRYTFAY